MAIKKQSSARRSRAPKSETLTLRIDPKSKFIVEFLALAVDRNITTVVERAVKSLADRTRVCMVYNREGELSDWKTWEDFWHVSEGIRTIRTIRESELRRGYEDDELLDFVKFHIEFFSEYNDLDNLDQIRVDIIWPYVDQCLANWGDRAKDGPWKAGHLMSQLLSKADVPPPEWPRSSTSPPQPIKQVPSGDLDDEIPF